MVTIVFMHQEKPLNLQRAIEIAVEAHRGQSDKAGAPYLLHPLRVMMSLDTDEERIVGVLHDVARPKPQHPTVTSAMCNAFTVTGP